MSSASPQNNSLFDRFVLVGILLLVTSLSMTGGWAFAQNVTKKLWLQVIIVALGGLLGFTVSFISKVWQKLENSFVDLAADWVKSRLLMIFSHYRRRYCQYVISEHQVFDVKGLSTQMAHSLELEHLFVELDVDPVPAHQTSANPLRMPEPLRHGKHVIWDYLGTSALKKEHFAIIGAPGSGKTTLLKHMALTLAQVKRSHHVNRISHTVPILLYLREYGSSIKDNPDFSLLDAIKVHMQKKWQQSELLQWISYCLIKGKCLILLDGLDEVADRDTRQWIVKWLERQMVVYSQNRFILTSRPHGYRDNPLEGINVLEVRPFTPKQIERFIYKWYLANELKSWGKEDLGIHMRAREGAQDLLQRLHHASALLALAVNPLLLTMIATVHRYRSSLPGKRVALYAEICEVFLGKRQEARGIALQLTPAQKQQVLQPLAYYLMQKGIREITLDDSQAVIAPYIAQVSANMEALDFLQDVQNTSGLLLERDPGIYGFAHLTFQEYLAAVYIKEEGQEQVLVDRVGASWWHETIRLYCAQADATKILEACLASEYPSAAALTLALECHEEKLKAHPSVTQHIDELLEKGIEDHDPIRRHLVAEALLTRRLRQMSYLDEETYIDTSLITCAEYQVFLDEQRVKGIFYQPDHWKAYTFMSSQGHKPVLGVRSSDATAFCTWLTTRNQEGWHYRLPTDNEYKKIEEDRDLSVKLMSGTGYWTNNGKDFAWAGTTPPSSNDLNDMIQNLVAHDLTLASARDLARDLAHDLARVRSSARARNLVRARNLAARNLAARNLALNHTHALTSTFDNALANALTHAHDLASALTHTRDLASTHDLVSAVEHDLANVLASVRTLADAHDRDRARELIRGLDLAHTLALDLASALDLDRALDLAHALALTHARDISSTISNDITCDISSTINTVFAGGFALDLGHVLNRASTLDRANVHAHAQALDLARAHARDLARAHNRNHASRSIGTTKKEISRDEDKVEFLHWSVRYFALILARFLRSLCDSSMAASSTRKRTPQDTAIFEHAIIGYLDLYVSLALLELRIQGKIPAWEGILLVKERKLKD